MSTAEVVIYGDIAGPGVDPAVIVHQLTAITTDRVVVRVNSYGGDLYGGIAIMNALRAHPAEVIVVVDGIAASAASVLAVGGGDRMVMAPHSALMIHSAWTGLEGNARDIRDTAQRLEAEDTRIAGVYAAKAGGSVEQWLEAMRDETWLSAEEAVARGLADEVATAGAYLPPVVHAQLTFTHTRPRAQAGGCVGEGGTVSFIRDVATRLGLSAGAKEDDVMKALDTRLGSDTPAPSHVTEHSDTQQPADIASVTVEDTDTTGVDETFDDTTGEEMRTETIDDTGEDTDAAGETESERGDESEQGESEQGGESDHGDDNDDESQAGDELIHICRQDWLYLKQLADEGLAARSEHTRAQAAAFAQRACDEGRISAALKQSWITRYIHDPEKAAADMATIPAGIIPRTELGHGVVDADDRAGRMSSIRAAGFPLTPRL